jgi:monofunctional biosynthetic peptidoglycan transglycosylase
MKTLIILFIAYMFTVDDHILFDFNSDSTSGDWFLVNDDVMGGRSNSNFISNSNGTVSFSGTLSATNNGGFASVRTFIQNDPQNQYDGVILRLRGDGKIYSIRFRTDRNFDGYAYQAKIQTEPNTWKVYKVPFDEFEPTFRGRKISGVPALESQNIAQIGVMIADKQFGEFNLDVDWISFYR